MKERNLIKLHPLLAHVYLELLPGIRETAKKNGYAIAVHGSLSRDFDLVAFKWSEDAVLKDELIRQICTDLGIECADEFLERKLERPFSRTSYDIQIGMGMYIDLSVVDSIHTTLNQEDIDFVAKANKMEQELENIKNASIAFHQEHGSLVIENRALKVEIAKLEVFKDAYETEIVRSHRKAKMWEHNFMMDCPVEVEDCDCALCAAAGKEEIDDEINQAKS